MEQFLVKRTLMARQQSTTLVFRIAAIFISQPHLTDFTRG